MRRSRTVEPTVSASVAPSMVKSPQMAKSYSDSGQIKVDEPFTPAERIHGLGSAATVVIQPKGLDVDEHGFKRGEGPLPPLSNRSAILPEPTKPLIHPTKDRAKKPKKHKAQGQDAPERPLFAGSVTPTRVPSINNGTADRRAFPVSQFSTKPTVASNPSASMTTSSGSGMVGRRALPGMTQPHSINSLSPKPARNSGTQPDNVPVPRALPGLATTDTPSFASGAHSRIPSTGGRPTAMDPNSLPTPRPRNMMPPSAQAEKRKSSYERYSVMLPPLKEEATPDPTPVSTLTRAIGNSFTQPDFDQVDWKALNRSEDVEDETANNLLEVTSNGSEMLHFVHIDEPLPRVDVSPLIQGYIAPDPSLDSQTIQVDVMAIAGSTAIPLGLTHIFYDTELLAIIHRSKSKTTGLTSSTVWSWRGKSSSLGSSEERKLAELAKRYGTSIVSIHQLAEPVELVRCLGGTLAVRQGSRAHWANENTAMHIVRSMHGVIYIDQVDLDVKNICSGFSYCVSILDTLFVWHGCGSTFVERQAATDYGRTLTSNPDDIIVLIENENGDDEMFWMVLGEEANYAKADYWKWRASVGFTSRIWSVEAGRKDPVLPLESFDRAESPQTSVYLMDCVFEFFVLVPSGARGKRRDISLALSVARDAAVRLASARPYTPTVHALILPSQIPVDLRVQFRDLEEVFLDAANIPDHMNVLPFEVAKDHLQATSWLKSQLQDRNMLPLGLDESHIP
ncbi:hypothetical protein B0H11DRAFT_2085464 [Mycena galericulata]|nr:hypothetical protein B0H11DRAFT_2085464 [Mycena galericulata]